MDTLARFRPWRSLPWLAALVLLCTAQLALAQQPAAPEADPPGRVGYLSYRQGSVVFAPEGEEEWVELPQNRPLTTGDRLWTDRGARAEVHLGAATLHVDGESHLGVSALDERSAQFILMQGSVNARVRDLLAGENFEVDTPHLALRAMQPGDYRVDVDPAGGHTRVVVHSGLATVYGEGGQAVNLAAGQQASFAGRMLAQVQSPPLRQDDFAQWAAERNRAEDQSISARHLPRGVVGYPQLDAHGSWSQDPTHGTVWYPNVTVQDWAPYRHGRWTWIDPWGWTWVDDAPWGFAPFHYGRWATIGHRWAWVPGRMAPRPVYSPGLVVFMGGNGVDLGVGSGPSVGWYPLAPGEAWYPTYRATPRYLGFVNFSINLGRYPRGYDNHFHRRHYHAVTVVREDDFRRGRHIPDHWRRVQPSGFDRARIGVAPGRPDFRDRRGERDNRFVAPRLQAPAPQFERGPFRRDQYVRPAQQWEDRRPQGRDNPVRERDRRDADRNDRNDRDRRDWNRGDADRDRAVREQAQAQREQQQLQRDAERRAREQIREARPQREREERAAPIRPAQRAEREERREQRVEKREERVERREQRAERRGDRAAERPDRGRGGNDRGGRGPRDDDGPGRGGRN
ncbi:MAG: DUF6600 domain-containing protein [Ramlibacter sp.]